MWSTLRSALSVALLIGLTCAVQAGTPGVKDNAGFFKDPAAVQKADAQARDLKQVYHKDVPVVNAVEDHAGYFSSDAVKKATAKIKETNQAWKKPVTFETLAKLPGGKAADVAKMSPGARNSYFDKLTQERAAETHADGVHV